MNTNEKENLDPGYEADIQQSPKLDAGNQDGAGDAPTESPKSDGQGGVATGEDGKSEASENGSEPSTALNEFVGKMEESAQAMNDSTVKAGIDLGVEMPGIIQQLQPVPGGFEPATASPIDGGPVDAPQSSLEAAEHGEPLPGKASCD